MSTFYEAPGSQIVTMTHGGGTLTLDHRKGTFFDVLATGNVTSIASVNERVPSTFIVRIKAFGGARTLDLTNLNPDAPLGAVTVLADGEFVTCQGLVSPNS